MKPLLLAFALLMLSGCMLGDSDNADSTTGPTVIVHCDAAQPVGDTTNKIACPTAQ